MAGAKVFWIICPVDGCGKMYQELAKLIPKEQVERSFKAHLTGKHCLSGEAFQKAFKTARRGEAQV